LSQQQAPLSQLPASTVWVLANPRAGRGHGRVVAAAIDQALTLAGRVVWINCEPPDQATPPRRPDAVVVVGGDGTLRAGVERLIALFGGDLPPVLPVPMGTANLIGQYLGLERGLLLMGLEGVQALAHAFSPDRIVRRLPRLRLGPLHLHPKRSARRVLRRLLPPAAQVARDAADRVVRALDRAEIHKIDLALANDRLFLLMAGVGFDAHVVHVLDERRSGPIGLLSYVLPAASAVARYGFPPVRVDVDGKRAFGPKPGVVMVANLPQYGTGFPLVPGARGDDGLLDILCLPCSSRAKLGQLLALAADGRHLEVTGAVHATGRRVDVISESAVPVQIDGDPGGRLPLHVRLHEHQLPLIKPMAS
jgi:diacylglycerol kinase family enzyme